jgi:hypothetical protein
MGQGMLKGTNQEWLAAPGATAANMASNMASGNQYQSLLAALNKASGNFASNPQTPGLASVSVKQSDPTGIAMPDTTFKFNNSPEGQDVPSTARPTLAAPVEQPIERNLASELSSRNFLEALRLYSRV